MNMTFKAAAEKILKQSDAPMAAAEITELAVEQNLISTEGATPEATMAAQLYVDIKKNPQSRFKRVGKGTFALKENKESATSSELIVATQNELVRQELKKRLHAMAPYQFEILMGELLSALGYENVVVTKQSGDGGIDVLADLTLKGITNVKTVVQVKRYKPTNNVSGSSVTQLRGSAEVDQRGLIITLSDFTKDGIAEAKAPNKMPVSLVNGEKLIDLLVEHEVGVKKELLPLYSIDSDWLESFNGTTSVAGSDGKRRGVWPMPGGTENYVAALRMAVQAIKAGASTKAKLAKWFLGAFEKVESQKTADGHAGVPIVLGMAVVENGELKLTAAGEKLLSGSGAEGLYESMCENVFGVVELMEFLQSEGTPVTPQQVLEFFNETLETGWKSLYQVSMRLSWLLGAGVLVKTDEGYSVA
jgi:restriction endonuclease Mrr